MSAPVTDRWVPCAAGELGRLGSRLRWRQALRFWLGAGVVALAVGAAAAAAWVGPSVAESMFTPSEAQPHNCPTCPAPTPCHPTPP